MANISATKTEDTGELIIKDNAGDPTDIVFILAGFSHPVRVETERKAQRPLLRSLNKTGKVAINEDPEDLWDEETERLVKLTIGWRNIQEDAADVPFSPEKAREYYDRRDLGFRQQVVAGLADRQVFTKRSSPNSLPTSSAASG